MRALAVILILALLVTGLGLAWVGQRRAELAERHATEMQREAEVARALMQFESQRSVHEPDPAGEGMVEFSEEERLRRENELLRAEAAELQALLDEVRATLDEATADR